MFLQSPIEIRMRIYLMESKNMPHASREKSQGRALLLTATAVSGSTVAVTISGNNATLTNLGTLNQTGTGRAIRDNTGVTGLTITRR